MTIQLARIQGNRRGTATDFLHSISGNQPWMAEGLCVGANPDLWFPPHGGSTLAARTVCDRCPVRNACLEYALTKPEDGGIWGGLGEDDRRELRRRRKRQEAKRRAQEGAA